MSCVPYPSSKTRLPELPWQVLGPEDESMCRSRNVSGGVRAISPMSPRHRTLPRPEDSGMADAQMLPLDNCSAEATQSSTAGRGSVMHFRLCAAHTNRDALGQLISDVGDRGHRIEGGTMTPVQFVCWLNELAECKNKSTDAVHRRCSN